MMKHDLETPIGTLRLVADRENLIRSTFIDDTPQEESTHPVLKQGAEQLDEYFKGKRQKFDLPLKPEGTDFQHLVWDLLSSIPYGSTLSYLELAKKAGDPNRIRAVGRANAANPIAIFIPCHRIIGGDGTLVGYAGGIHRKEWLLKHEGKLLL